MVDADVVVVGGRVAGCALAMHLARAGRSVLLLEKDAHLAEKPCGEGIMPAGVGALARLGVTGAIGSAGRPFHGIAFSVLGRRVVGAFDPASGSGLGVRRRVLDAALFGAAARTPGVTAIQGLRVRRLLSEGGRVVGVGARRREGGGDEELRARLVVGADGHLSPVRRLLGWEGGPGRPSGRCGIVVHLAPPIEPASTVEVLVDPGVGELYVTPLGEGEVLVALLTDLTHLRAFAGDLHARFLAYLEASPAAPWAAGAALRSPVRALGPLDGRVRRVVGAGAALVGDAAGFLDPLNGGGMTQALLGADWLAACVAGPLQAGEPLDRALLAYARGRAAALVGPRRVAALTGLLGAHPRLASAALGLLGPRPAALAWLLAANAGPDRWGSPGGATPAQGLRGADLTDGSV